MKHLASPGEVLEELIRLHRDNAQLRWWLRRWLTTAPISLCLNLATKRLRSEINAALKGDAPPKRRAR